MQTVENIGYLQPFSPSVIAKPGSFASLRINSAKQSGILDQESQIASSSTPLK
jgi:hypothetical protein